MGISDCEIETFGEVEIETVGENEPVGISVDNIDSDGEDDLEGSNDTDGLGETVGILDGLGETVGISVGYDVGLRVLCRSHSRWFKYLNSMQLMEPVISLSTACSRGRML